MSAAALIRTGFAVAGALAAFAAGPAFAQSSDNPAMYRGPDRE